MHRGGEREELAMRLTDPWKWRDVRLVMLTQAKPIDCHEAKRDAVGRETEQRCPDMGAEGGTAVSFENLTQA